MPRRWPVMRGAAASAWRLALFFRCVATFLVRDVWPRVRAGVRLIASSLLPWFTCRQRLLRSPRLAVIFRSASLVKPCRASIAWRAGLHPTVPESRARAARRCGSLRVIALLPAGGYLRRVLPAVARRCRLARSIVRGGLRRASVQVFSETCDQRRGQRALGLPRIVARRISFPPYAEDGRASVIDAFGRYFINHKFARPVL